MFNRPSTLRDPITALRTGELVMAFDEDLPRGGAELWLAAEIAAGEQFAQLVRYTSGFVMVALPVARAAALALPPMVGGPIVGNQPVQAVTCDAAHGASTGISARDRALTARLLADVTSTPDDFTRPGHVVPLRVPAGLNEGRSRAGAALRLCALAGLAPAMIRCELVLDSGATARAAEGLEIARSMGWTVISQRDLAPRRMRVPLIA